MTFLHQAHENFTCLYSTSRICLGLYSAHSLLIYLCGNCDNYTVFKEQSQFELTCMLPSSARTLLHPELKACLLEIEKLQHKKERPFQKAALEPLCADSSLQGRQPEPAS